MDLNEVAKGILMLFILFCYIGGFVFWAVLSVILFDAFGEIKHINLNIKRKELDE